MRSRNRAPSRAVWGRAVYLRGTPGRAGVVKLADARDSKSRDLQVVRVRPPPPAPIQFNDLRGFAWRVLFGFWPTVPEIVPAAPIDFCGGITERGRIDDRIARIDRLRLVSDHRHRCGPGAPSRSRFRTADRRKPWRRRPGCRSSKPQSQALRTCLIDFPLRWNTRRHDSVRLLYPKRIPDPPCRVLHQAQMQISLRHTFETPSRQASARIHSSTLRTLVSLSRARTARLRTVSGMAL